MFSLKKNYYNIVNEISFTSNFDHVLIYIMYKFHGSTTFINLIFQLKVSPPKCRYLATFGPESLPMCFRCLV